MIQNLFQWCRIPYGVLNDADLANAALDRLLWLGEFRFDLSTIIVFVTMWWAIFGIGFFLYESALRYARHNH